MHTGISAKSALVPVTTEPPHADEEARYEAASAAAQAPAVGPRGVPVQTRDLSAAFGVGETNFGYPGARRGGGMLNLAERGGHQHMGFFNHGPFTGARSFVRAVPK